MRVNIYAEEITKEVEVATSTPPTGNQFIGIRFILESSDKLHHRTNDDDRSAVTFWVPGSRDKGFNTDALIETFRRAIGLLETWKGNNP